MSTPYRFNHIGPYMNTAVNYIHAVACRAKLVKRAGEYQPRPPVAPGASYALVLSGLSGVIKRKYGQDTTAACCRLTSAEFVASRPSWTRAAYQRAVDSRRFEVMGLRDLTKLKGFVKVEKSGQPFTDRDGNITALKAPRPIHPRDFGFNEVFGRFTLPMEHPTYDSMAEMCGYTYFDDGTAETLAVIAKGLNPFEKADLIRKHWLRAGGDGKVVALNVDQGGFDAHIAELELRLEGDVAQLFYPGNKFLRRLMRAQWANRVRAVFRDGRVNTKLGPMRMSGDMNTSLGNCLISAALAWLFVRTIKNASFIVDGDDTILFIPLDYFTNNTLDALQAHYLDFGFDAVAEEPCFWMEAICFCQSHPLFDGTRWRMVRNWTKCTGFDYSSHDCGTDGIAFREHLHAVGSCGLALHYGVPILQEHYLFGLRHGIKSKLDWAKYRRNYIFDQARACGGFRRQATVTDDARVSFWLAFGVTPDMQIAIEKEYESASYSDHITDLREVPASEIITYQDVYTNKPHGYYRND